MEEKNKKKWNIKECKHASYGGSGVYGLGMIGIFIYYIQHAATFMDVLIAFGKSVFWPAFLLYKVYTLLGM